MEKLWVHIKTERYNFGANECEKLIKSMPKRFEAMLEAKGMWTDY